MRQQNRVFGQMTYIPVALLKKSRAVSRHQKRSTRVTRLRLLYFVWTLIFPPVVVFSLVDRIIRVFRRNSGLRVGVKSFMQQ